MKRFTTVTIATGTWPTPETELLEEAIDAIAIAVDHGRRAVKKLYAEYHRDADLPADEQWAEGTSLGHALDHIEEINRRLQKQWEAAERLAPL